MPTDGLGGHGKLHGAFIWRPLPVMCGSMVIDPFIDLYSVQTLGLKTKCTTDNGNQPSAIRVEPPDFLHRNHEFRWIKMRVPGLAGAGKVTNRPCYRRGQKINEGNPAERVIDAARTGHALLREKRVARPRIDGRSLALALQHVQLSLDLAPLVGVGRRRFALVDDRPRLRQLRVEVEVMPLMFRQIIFGEDCIHRALRFTKRAINTLVGVDDQHVGTFMEAIDRAHLHAVRVLALYTGFDNDERHCLLFSKGLLLL